MKVYYFARGRWVLGGVFQTVESRDAFCEWLAADGIEWKAES